MDLLCSLLDNKYCCGHNVNQEHQEGSEHWEENPFDGRETEAKEAVHNCQNEARGDCVSQEIE